MLSKSVSNRSRRPAFFEYPGGSLTGGRPSAVQLVRTYEVMPWEERPEDVVIRAGDLDTLNPPENVHLVAAHTRPEGIEAALVEKMGPFEKPWEVLR